jgi:hypothetical protein
MVRRRSQIEAQSTGKESAMTKILAIVAAGLAAVSIVALAAAWTGESTDEAKADVCESLDDVSSAYTTYDALDPRTATIGELDEAEDNLEEAWDDLVYDAEDWVNADDNVLTEAYDNLYYAYQDLPDDYTVAQSLDALEDELEAIPPAYAEAFDGSGCADS